MREDQIQRYARHVLLREVGGVGQVRLLGARVLLGGGAGLEVAATYLTAAGIGTLRVLGAVDEERLRALNPDVDVRTCDDPDGPFDAVAALFGDPRAIEASDVAVASHSPLVLVLPDATAAFRLGWARAGVEGCARCARAEGSGEPTPAEAALAGAWAASEVLLAVLGRAEHRYGESVPVSRGGVTGALACLRPEGGACTTCGTGTAR